MGDRVVLWSDGGRYVATKDIASAAIVEQSGGLLVDWGGGDTEILPGVFQETLNITSGCTRWNFQRQMRYRVNNQIAVPWQNVNLISETKPIFYEKFECNDGLTYRFQAVGVRQDYLVICGSQTYNTAWFCDIGQKILFEYTFLSTADSNLWEFRNFSKENLQGGSVIGYQVISTEGQSIRLQTTAPIIQTVTGCVIRIQFTDNSIVDIPVNPCPVWVQIVPDKQCPPDTCHECEHEGLKCCYSLGQDGLFHLIDSFHV